MLPFLIFKIALKFLQNPLDKREKVVLKYIKIYRDII